MVSKIALAFKYSAFNKDTCQLSGNIGNLLQAFPFINKSVHIDIGGALANFPLTPKGSSRGFAGTFAFKVKFKKNKMNGALEFIGGTMPFQARYKGTFSDDWAGEGVDPDANPVKLGITMPVDFVFNGAVYTFDAPALLTSKMHRGGKFKK